jgi:hypothetical protein
VITKPAHLRVRPKIGDLIEVETSKGLGYLQYTHHTDDAFNQYLLRAIEGLYPERPKDLDALAGNPHIFQTFTALGSALQGRMMRIVHNAPVPEFAARFPLFKAAGAIDLQGRVLNWWLWDGTCSIFIGDLPREFHRLPVRSFVSFSVLVDMLEEQWRPETDIRVRNL